MLDLIERDTDREFLASLGVSNDESNQLGGDHESRHPG
jgi:hypothetical protein